MVRTVNLVTDVVLPFAANRVLVEGLAISDIPLFKGNAKRLRWVLQYEGASVEIGGSTSNVDWFLRGQWEVGLQGQPTSQLPLIGIPGGHLGIQAFYLILENFWRNLIKHNVQEVRERLCQHDTDITIHIQIEDRTDTPFWRVRLWADVEKTDVETTDDPAKQICEILKKGIIDEEGKLIPEGWGTKEMLTAAAYLRGCPLTDVQTKGTEILRCYMHQDKYLCYDFDVLKPMELFIVTRQEVEEPLKKTLLTRGVYVSSEIAKDLIVPTEYFIVEPSNATEAVPELDNEPLKPLKRFSKKVDIKGLENESTLTDLLIELEVDFAKRLMEDENTPVCFVIRSPDSEDSQLCVSSPQNLPLQIERREELLSEEDIKRRVKQYFVVIFDRHGAYNRNDTMVRLSPERLFWEPYGAGTSTAFVLQHVPDDDKKKLLLIWRIISSSLLKVAILDERVQQILENSQPWRYGYDAPPVKPLECLKMMRVYIPKGEQGELRLENPDENAIQRWICSKRPHVLSIHAGILDKMGRKTSKEVLQWIERTIQCLDSKVRRIVIHSGRGIPVNVPELKVPFVGYTAIEHYVTSKDLKSKYALVQELLSARGIRR